MGKEVYHNRQKKKKKKKKKACALEVCRPEHTFTIINVSDTQHNRQLVPI